MPVHNNTSDLEECLAALLTGPAPPNTEIIVVDDASTDDTPSVAARRGARVLRLQKNSGPAAARNHGARHARGEILFFVDADVVVAPGAVERVARLFQDRPGVAAVFGSYDAHPRAKGLISQYRNLLHHFVHQEGSSEASTFWAGCGAIRRSVFHEVGGFDEKRFPRPSIEDIELGYRLRRAGHRILLDKELQGTHLKHWNLGRVIRTDITCRAIPWARLILESKRAPDDLNLKRSQRVSAGLVALAGILLLLSPLRVELMGAALVVLVAVVAVNGKLFKFFFRQRGLRFALACIPLHLLYFLYSGLSYVWVLIGWQLTNLPTRHGGAVQRG